LERVDEAADVVGEQLRLLVGGEVAAARHLCPSLDVVGALGELAWGAFEVAPVSDQLLEELGRRSALPPFVVDLVDPTTAPQGAERLVARLEPRSDTARQPAQPPTRLTTSSLHHGSRRLTRTARRTGRVIAVISARPGGQADVGPSLDEGVIRRHRTQIGVGPSSSAGVRGTGIGAFMERSGRNRWQPVANGSALSAARAAATFSALGSNAYTNAARSAAIEHPLPIEADELDDRGCLDRGVVAPLIRSSACKP
jgi:hypothetical protein